MQSHHTLTTSCVFFASALAACSTAESESDGGAWTRSSTVGDNRDSGAKAADGGAHRYDGGRDTSCDFASPGQWPTLEVVLHNVSGETRYVLPHDSWLQSDSLGVDLGGAPPGTLSLRTNQPTCADIAGGRHDCGTHYDGAALTTVIAPGTERTLHWNGIAWRAETIAPACSGHGEPCHCVQPEPAPAGAYRIALEVYPRCEQCNCDPEASFCEDGAQPDGNAAALGANLAWPEETRVVLEIE